MVDITDVPGRTRLLSQIRSAFHECTDLSMGVVVVFGSYGRGDATKGVSDLDIQVFIDPQDVEVTVAAVKVGVCMEKPYKTETILDGFYDWFIDGDVMTSGKMNQWRLLFQRMMQGPTPRRVYSLTAGRFYDIEVVEERKEVEDLKNEIKFLKKRGMYDEDSRRVEVMRQRIEGMTNGKNIYTDG